MSRRIYGKTYERKVSRTLTVRFKGGEYDVRDVPGVEVGGTLQLVIFRFEYPQAVSIWLPGAPVAPFRSAPLVERDTGRAA